MITCTRRIQFCAGHRVMGHENKCAHLHGHNYVVFVTARQLDQSLDSVGRVIDFSVLKERVGGWIERNWDHGFILNFDDAKMQALLCMRPIDDKGTLQKLHVIPYNPTAENMAKYLLKEVGPNVLEGTDVELISVVVHETENCQAEATLK